MTYEAWCPKEMVALRPATDAERLAYLAQPGRFVDEPFELFLMLAQLGLRFAQRLVLEIQRRGILASPGFPLAVGVGRLTRKEHILISKEKPPGLADPG